MASGRSCTDVPRALLRAARADGTGRRARFAVRDFGDEFLGLGGRTSLGERDTRAVGGEPPHDRRSDAARSAGDQCMPSLQVCHVQVCHVLVKAVGVTKIPLMAATTLG